MTTGIHHRRLLGPYLRLRRALDRTVYETTPHVFLRIRRLVPEIMAGPVNWAPAEIPMPDLIRPDPAISAGPPLDPPEIAQAASRENAPLEVSAESTLVPEANEASGDRTSHSSSMPNDHAPGQEEVRASSDPFRNRIASAHASKAKENRPIDHDNTHPAKDRGPLLRATQTNRFAKHIPSRPISGDGLNEARYPRTLLNRPVTETSAQGTSRNSPSTHESAAPHSERAGSEASGFSGPVRPGAGLSRQANAPASPTTPQPTRRMDARITELPAGRQSRPDRAATEPGAIPSATAREPMPDGEKRGDPDTGPQANAELFNPRNDIDRSPLLWASRLFEPRSPVSDPGDRKDESRLSDRTRTQSPGHNSPRARMLDQAHAAAGSLDAAPVSEDSAETLTVSAREFLTETVGIDPSTVTVRHSAAAAARTAAYDADAIAAQGEIDISPRYGNETPEHLALIAHELTHIARERNDGFIPPIARADPPSRIPASTAMPNIQQSDGVEEALAQLVENRTHALARDSRKVNSVDTRGEGADSPELNLDARPRSAIAGQAYSGFWSGLPAPWEPVPPWMADSPGESAKSNPPPAGTNAPFEHGEPGGQVAPRFAARDRNVADEPTVLETDERKRNQHAAHPDPEMLAHEVYEILKRRLAAERRRNLY